MLVMVNTKDFIERSRKIHGDKYDYSKSIYKAARKKIVIVCPIHGMFFQAAWDHMIGQGCSKCGRTRSNKSKLIPYDEVIRRFQKAHGNKYDYSKVMYKNKNTNVEIVCPVHGLFFQLPTNHWDGHGCPKCGGSEPLNKNMFIKRATEVHGDKYNYSKVKYVNMRTKILIICKQDGEGFLQQPYSHLNGNGCPNCAGKLIDTNTFIERSRTAHGNKYNYSKVIYKIANEKVKIICPIHGEFEQGAYAHMKRCGCPSCAGNMTSDKETFIRKAKEVHGNKYNYSQVVYKNNKTKIKIICPSHGTFQQKPDNHLYGQGCGKCVTRVSNKSQKWLEWFNNIEPEYLIIIDEKKYFVDGFNKKTNTVYEFYGDFWHGNRKIFDQDDINPVNKTTYGELYRKTIEREKIILSAGYKLITIWESDFDTEMKNII